MADDLLDDLIWREAESIASIRQSMESRSNSSPLVVVQVEMNTFDVTIDYERQTVLIEDVLDADRRMEVPLSEFRRRLQN